MCRCRECEAGVVILGHCIDINGEPWHECVALGDDVDDPELVGGDGER